MSKYATGETSIKVVRNAEFIASISTEPETKIKQKPRKKAKSQQFLMGKSKKKLARGAQQRERLNPTTRAVEVISGTKAGKRRARLPFGHPLRTHDIRGKKDKRTD